MVEFRTLVATFVVVGCLVAPTIAQLVIPTIAQIFALLALNLLRLLGINILDNLNPIHTTINMTVPSFADTNRTVNYAFAVYCPIAQIETWSCGPKCDNAGGADNTVIEVLEDSLQKTRGMVAVNTARWEIIVAFRGSYDVMNFVEDGLSVVLTDFPLTGGTNVQVSLGFKMATESLYDTLVTPNLRGLVEIYPEYKVVITGHSLGAAMAELTFAKLKDSTEFGGKNLILYKYGSPRVGNIGFANWMNSKTNGVIRVVNKADIFCHIFLAIEGYVHSGNEFWRQADGTDVLCDRTVYEDPNCSNSLAPLYNSNDHQNYMGVPKDGCAV